MRPVQLEVCVGKAGKYSPGVKRSLSARQTHLLALVEEEARHRGCQHSVVETSTFQAPGFYERHGYEKFGRVPFSVPGEARVFLRKELA